MKISDSLESARYMVDPKGNRTDVVIPLETWQKLLSAWERLIERLEDQEDRAILQEWLVRRASGEKDTITLAKLEKELVADGLLPG
jgi:hypothetical protein